MSIQQLMQKSVLYFCQIVRYLDTSLHRGFKNSDKFSSRYIFTKTNINLDNMVYIYNMYIYIYSLNIYMPYKYLVYIHIVYKIFQIDGPKASGLFDPEIAGAFEFLNLVSILSSLLRRGRTS